MSHFPPPSHLSLWITLDVRGAETDRVDGGSVLLLPEKTFFGFLSCPYQQKGAKVHSHVSINRNLCQGLISPPPAAAWLSPPLRGTRLPLDQGVLGEIISCKNCQCVLYRTVVFFSICGLWPTVNSVSRGMGGMDKAWWGKFESPNQQGKTCLVDVWRRGSGGRGDLLFSFPSLLGGRETQSVGDDSSSSSNSNGSADKSPDNPAHGEDVDEGGERHHQQKHFVVWLFYERTMAAYVIPTECF